MYAPPTVEQLLARLKQISQKSNRRKSALKQLIKRFDIEVHYNRDLSNRLVTITSYYNDSCKQQQRQKKEIEELSESNKRMREVIYKQPECSRLHIPLL